jgi:hypothetical protein
MKNSTWLKIGWLALLAFGLTTQTSNAVILFGSGDPAYNTTPPAGALTNSGWQYEGQWGGFLGTPIAPQYFIAAQHVGGSIGQTFTFNGVSYTTTAYRDDPNSDLRIWKVNGTFPIYAPLYTTNDEVGKFMVDIGRGTQRGDPVMLTEAQAVSTTNVVNLSELGISKQAAKVEFPEATFQKETIMTVVTTTYTMNGVNPNALAFSKQTGRKELPSARFPGSVMTVLTPVYTTNVVDLTALGISERAARREFPLAKIETQWVMTEVTSGLVTNTVLKGWQDGPSDGVMRWGQNKVTDAGYYLMTAFTGTNGPNEGYLSSGDSSGAVFIQDDTGTWKLAGINYAIEGPFATSPNSSAFYGAIFDESGLYNGCYLVPADGGLQPASYYATRISLRVAWIQSVISQ